MNYDEGIYDERSEIASQSQSPPLLAALKSAVYKVSYIHSGSLISPRHESFFRASPQLLVAIVQSVQLLGIVLDYAADVTGYKDLDYYLWSFNLFRPEILAADYSDPLVAYYLFLVLVSLGVASRLTEIGLILARPELVLPRSLMVFSTVLFGLLHRVLLFPATLLFLQYTTRSSSYWSQALAAGGLAGTFLLLLSGVLFVSDNNWYIRKFHLFAKSGHDFEVKEVAIFMFISALNLGLFGSSLVINCGLMLLATGYLSYQVQVTAPYFNIVTQCTKAVQYTLANWMAVCVLLGRLCDSAEVIFLLFVFVSPLLGVFSVVAVRWRLKHWKRAENCKVYWEFEVALRRMLEKFGKGKVTDGILKAVIANGAKRFAKNKLSHLLFAQYYFYIRNEPEYALLRLACANDCSSSPLSDYQVYHFFEKVSELAKSEERGYLDYISYYRNAMRADLSLSTEACTFINLLLTPLRNSSKLATALSDLSTRIKEVEQHYETITQRFPHDFLMRTQNRSLRADLFFDDPGAEVVAKVNPRAVGKTVNTSNIEAYTTLDTGVFVISCHHARFGKIVFANHRCAELLDTTVEEIESRDLDDYLPPPLAVGHNKIMANFIRAGEAKEIFRSHLFLYANSRYSVEVTFRFRPSSFRGVPYFVVAIRGKPSTRQFALFDNNFLITSHSKSFDLILGVPLNERGTLNGLSLVTMMPGIDKLYREMNEKPFVYVHPDTKVGFHVLFSSTGLGSHILRWMYLFKEESQISDLLESSSRYLLERRFTLASILKHRKTIEEADNESDSSSQASSSRHQVDPLPENSALSFSQLTSFAMSLMGFKIRESVKTAEKQYNLSFIVGAALSALLAFVNLLVLFVTMEEMAAAHDAVSSSLLMAPVHMAKITYFTRVLSLMEAGLEDQSRFGAVSNVIKAEAGELQSISTANIADSGGPLLVTVWSQYLHRQKNTLEGVASALSDFLTRVNAFVSAEKFTESDDFYYIYRNGVGEMFEMTKNKGGNVAEAVDNRSKVKIINAAVVAFLLTAGILGISVVFIVKSIVLLSKNYEKLWKLILNLKPEQLHTLTGPYLERMAALHRVKDLPKIRKGGKRAKNLGLAPKRRWPVLMATFFLYILTSSSIFFLAGLYGYTQLSSFISSSLSAIDTASSMVPRPLIALFFLKETYLDVVHSQGYLHLVPNGQEIPATSARVQSELTALDLDIEATFRQMTAAGREDVFLSDLCGYFGNYTECRSSAMAFGLHFAVHEYRNTVESTLETLAQGGTTPWSLFPPLETQAVFLTDALQLAFTTTVDSAKADIASFRSTMVLYFSLYCFGCVLLYVCFYRPRIVQLKRDCLTLWHVSKLVRADFISVKKKQ